MKIKPKVRKVRSDEYLSFYMDTLPWVMISDGFYCLTTSWKSAIDAAINVYK